MPYISKWEKIYWNYQARALETRWHKDGSGYKGQVVYDAIVKYGWDNVKHEILEEGLSEEEAQFYEK